MPAEKLRAGIVGVGSYLPEKILTNHDLSMQVNTSDEWIRTRTGIRERRIASAEQAASDLGAAAARMALENAGVSADEVDLVIVATATPDMQFPSTACIIQERLGLSRAAAFDLTAGCSGFVYALTVADQFIASGLYRTILVIGTEVLSRILDWEDRSTCVLLADGAGAVVLQPAAPGYGILSAKLGADGKGGKYLYLPAGGSRMPITPEALAENLHKLKMNGQDVFKFAMRILPEATFQALEAAGIGKEEVALIIPHQANLRIIEGAAKRMDLPMDKFMINLDKYGNTSSASVPTALFEALESGRVQDGDIIVMTAFGAGLTWGSVVLRWKAL